MGIAATMMSDIFGGALPKIVTPAFVSGYVGFIASANMLGRFAFRNSPNF